MIFDPTATTTTAHDLAEYTDVELLDGWYRIAEVTAHGDTIHLTAIRPNGHVATRTIPGGVAVTVR